MLQIHTDNGKTPADPQVQVESDPVSLRRELEAARQALRSQTARWRLVDAALHRKLEQKEQEARSWRTLRDQQLSHVTRALMMLEARLRREQRNIRSLLGERDAVIRAQQQEIARLRKALDPAARAQHQAEQTTTLPAFQYDCDVKPDLISSLGISHVRREKSTTPTTTDNEDSQSNLDSLQLSFYELGSQPESLLSNLSTQSCNGDHEHSDLCKELDAPAESPGGNCVESSARIFNNFHPELGSCRSQEHGNLKKLEVKVHMEHYPPQKNVLSPVKEESLLSIPSTCNSPSRRNPCEDRKEEILQVIVHQESEAKPSPSTLLQEVRISGRNEYEDNPVLNCVNQILLRDQEEFLEEQRALRLKEQEKKKEAEAKLNNKKLTKSTENLTLLNDQIIVQHSPLKKVYPPLESVTNHTVIEQAIKETTENEFEEDHYKSIIKMPTPKKLSLPKENLQVKIMPPALPPKPQRLVLSKSLDQKTLLNSLLPALKGDDSDPIEMLKKRSSLPNPSPDSELYVISNSAIDDELLQRLQGRRIKSCVELPPTLNKSKPASQSRESLYAPVISHPTHKPPPKPVLPTSPNAQADKPIEQKSSPKKSPQPKTEEPPRTPPKQSPVKKITSPKSCIKVASPVSSLLNSGDAIEPGEESEKKTSPSVSQIVRRFEEIVSKPKEETKAEDSSDNLQKNFEEFRLDECDMDTLCGDGRPEGDGAETRVNPSAVLESTVSYENFLEATGLSQKSIVTPSRLFSNHKSVLKPKDVKHRSRVKAAAVVDRCNAASAPSGNIVRYWTEPFL